MEKKSVKGIYQILKNTILFSRTVNICFYMATKGISMWCLFITTTQKARCSTLSQTTGNVNALVILLYLPVFDLDIIFIQTLGLVMFYCFYYLWEDATPGQILFFVAPHLFTPAVKVM